MTRLGDVFHASKQPLYPTVPLAVVAAVIVTASPFLTRPMRRVGQVVLALAAFGTLYRGDGSVNAVTAALVLGWGIAALLHLVMGSPAGRPTVAQITAALTDLGVDSSGVRLAPEQTSGFTAVAGERDRRRAAARARLWA